MSPEEFAEHQRTYRAFVRSIFAAVVLALLTLAILAWMFSDSFGMAGRRELPP